MQKNNSVVITLIIPLEQICVKILILNPVIEMEFSRKLELAQRT